MIVDFGEDKWFGAIDTQRVRVGSVSTDQPDDCEPLSN
jgi:hypothetical protein